MKTEIIPFKFSETIIQKALFAKFQSHKYKFTNIYFFENESDWLSFLPNGMCYEIEVKISRSDFKADFKKVKHKIHNTDSGYFIHSKRNVLINNPTWQQCRDFPQLIEAKEYSEWNRFKEEMQSRIYINMHASTQISFATKSNLKLPNKFYYAVPKGLIDASEIPDYAGLLYIDEFLNVEKIKEAKFIHKDELDVKKIFNKTYHAYESMLRNNLNTK